MPSINRLLLFVLSPALLGAAQPGQSPAPPPPVQRADAPAQADEVGTQLVETFARFCLDRFPNRADLSEGEGDKAMPMRPETVREFLHDDPGRGWFFRPSGQPGETYAVTVEDPPYKACAVRRMYPTAPGFGTAYQARITAWATAQRRGSFSPPRGFSQVRDGMDIRANAQQLAARPGMPAEVFMAFTTSYLNGQVEIRLVRQIPDPRLLNR